jgi:hypothetical protein
MYSIKNGGVNLSDNDFDVYNNWRKNYKTASNGYKIQLKNDIVYIGYKFVSLLKSMPIVANDVTAKKRITNLLVRFVDSFMPIIKCGDLPDEHFNNEKESFSGVKSVIYPGNSERDVTFTIHIDNPVRCNILSVNAKVV